MLINAKGNSEVSASGASASAVFTIAASGKAFDILSSGLYSRKAEAVVRELSCNAVDGHIAAGKGDVPIEVQLPTVQDPVFHVRDYGVGLSKEDVMSLYTTYFASTKAESNDFTGAFGLGSKAPYAYTDTFTVVSTHGGARRTYICAKEDFGNPKIMLFSEEQTSDSNGVDVSFPVEPADFKSFAEAAERVFAYFAVPPVILGAPAVAPRKYEVTLDVPEVPGVRAHFGEGASGILMGNVMYPLSFAALSEASLVLAKCFADSGMIIEVPIGFTNVAASREELQYDRVSVGNLKEAVQSVNAVLKAWFETQVQAIRDRYDSQPVPRCRAFGRFLRRFGQLNAAMQHYLPVADWALVASRSVTLDYRGLVGVSALRYGKGSSKHAWSKVPLHEDNVFQISPQAESLEIWLADTPGAERRLRAYLRTQHPAGVESCGLHAVLFCNSAAEAEQLVGRLGLTLADVRKASTLADARPPGGAKTAKSARASLSGTVGMVSTHVSSSPVRTEMGAAMAVTGGFYIETTVGRTGGLHLDIPGFGTFESYDSLSARELCERLTDAKTEYLDGDIPKKVMMIPASALAAFRKQVDTLAKEIDDEEEASELKLQDLGEWMGPRLNIAALQRDARLYSQLGVGQEEAPGEFRQWNALRQMYAAAPEAVQRLLVTALNTSDSGLGTLLAEAMGERARSRTLALRGSLMRYTAGKFPTEVMQGKQSVGVRFQLILGDTHLALQHHSSSPKAYAVLLKATLLACGVSLTKLAAVFGELTSVPASPAPTAPKVKVESARAQLSLVFDADASAMCRVAA